MKIKEETLAILSKLEFEGNHARIVEQLDRKTYVAVNKVLMAAGGKWNRKAKAHVFPFDAAETIDNVILTGEVTTNREIGFFPTPTKIAKDLVAMGGVEEGDVVLEPSAGTGMIIDALLEVGAQVNAVEVDVAMQQQLREKYGSDIRFLSEDFMTCPPDFPCDKVIMNPPFAKTKGHDCLDHVQHAWGFLREGGTLVSVLPSGVEFRQDKRHVAFRAWVEEKGGEMTSLPALSFRPSGTDVSTLVLRMRKGAA